MPIIKSAVKRVKQANANRERNVATKRAVKAAMKDFQAKPSAASLGKVHSELDKALKKNLLHKNTVARRKASIAKLAKDAGVKLSTGTKKAAKPATKSAEKAAPKPKTAAAKKPATKKPATKKATDKPAAKKK